MADREYERNSVEREENAIRKETEAAGWICPDCGRAFKKKNQSQGILAFSAPRFILPRIRLFVNVNTLSDGVMPYILWA